VAGLVISSPLIRAMRRWWRRRENTRTRKAPSC